MTDREQVIELTAQLLYSIVCDELNQFIDEYKLDIRRTRKWNELPDTPSKACWREQATRFLVLRPPCEECEGSGIANPDDFDQNYEPCEKCGGSGLERVLFTKKEKP